MSDERTPLETYDLRVFWNKKERDIMYDGPCGPDRHLMHGVLTMRRPRGGLSDGFDRSLHDELIMRGYDISTLKITVRRFKHPWISCGRDVWHRKTGEQRRVHHVRYERGEAFVRLLGQRESFDSVEVPRDVRWADTYRPLADVEREYQPEPPMPLRVMLVAEGAGL